MNNEKLNKVASALKGQNGCFLIGKIEGVDFNASGVVEGNAYSASVKLKFAENKDIVKKINGVDILTSAYMTRIIKIPCADSELAQKVQEYNSKKGKEVIIELDLGDNSSFKTTNIQELI